MVEQEGGRGLCLVSLPDVGCDYFTARERRLPVRIIPVIGRVLGAMEVPVCVMGLFTYLAGFGCGLG